MARDFYTHTTQNPPIVWLKSGRSSSLAHSKTNTFMAPWAPFKSIDPFTCICPPIQYPTAVGKHHEHVQPSHPLPQHPIVQLKSSRSSSLTQSKSKTFIAPQILVSDSNTMEVRTPLCHNNQRQVGAGRPPTRHQVVSGVAPSKSCSDLGSDLGPFVRKWRPNRWILLHVSRTFQQRSAAERAML